MDEVEKKLDEIEQAREKIQAQVSASMEVLGDIAEAIEDAKTRQVERMRADTRVDEAIIEQVQGDTEQE